MDTLDYTSWGISLRRRVAGRRVPLGGTIELTRRCNNRCAHCYNNLPADDRAAQEELGEGAWKRILDEAAEAGCLYLLFTGGEPLLRPDFGAIYEHARRRGFFVTLFTNGTHLTEETADLLAAMPPLAVEVTLYGATRTTWERVTGVPGSYERSLAGIERLRRRGVRLRLKTTLRHAPAGRLVRCAVSVRRLVERPARRFSRAAFPPALAGGGGGFRPRGSGARERPAGGRVAASPPRRRPLCLRGGASRLRRRPRGQAQALCPLRRRGGLRSAAGLVPRGLGGPARPRARTAWRNRQPLPRLRPDRPLRNLPRGIPSRVRGGVGPGRVSLPRRPSSRLRPGDGRLPPRPLRALPGRGATRGDRRLRRGVEGRFPVGAGRRRAECLTSWWRRP